MDVPSPAPRPGRAILTHYGAAAAAVVIALAVKLLLDQVVDTGAPFLLFPLAILVAAWFGGLGPGLFATALATLLGGLFLSPDSRTTAVVVRGIIFVLQGVGISLIALALQRARRGAEEDAARARATERVVRELAEANRRAAIILESISEIFFSLDRQWRITHVNRDYRESPVPGLECVQLGEVLWDVFPELVGTPVEERYRRAMETGEPVRFEGSGVFSGRWYEIRVYPSAEGLSVFATDLTERRQAEEAVRAAQAEAEKANRMKDQFLATLSHELRTPLNAIFGWAQLLRAGKLDPATVERGLETIERNARAQKQLIDDLLDVSRIISGKLRLEMQPVEPASVVEAALETIGPAAQAKGVVLRPRVDRTGLVVGDPQRLQQVVWNLLSNAIKFTPRGGEVRVSVEALDGHTRIIVADSGYGIAPEFLPHVFERFRQADPSSTRRHGGLGLGLAIVRQLVELHGGTIRAESPGEGRGATFIVSLPLAVSSEPEERRRTKGEGGGRSMSLSLDGVRVLVVDDEADARDLLSQILSRSHAEVAVAASAAEGLEVLERFQPHVLVSDISMPGADGYEFIRTLRKRGHHLPAAALTAFARAEDRRRALLAGFQIHLAKPIDPGELTAAVASLAGRAGEAGPDADPE